VTSVVVVATSSSVNNVAPGALGFLVVAGIAVALVFLLRSMNKQFHKIAPDPSATPSAVGTSADGAPAVGAQTPRADQPLAGPSSPS
jgi:hypothetical protein